MVVEIALGIVLAIIILHLIPLSFIFLAYIGGLLWTAFEFIRDSIFSKEEEEEVDPVDRELEEHLTKKEDEAEKIGDDLRNED